MRCFLHPEAEPHTDAAQHCCTTCHFVAATAVPVLLRTLNLLLHTADVTVLEVGDQVPFIPATMH
jgi:hypothetical protein